MKKIILDTNFLMAVGQFKVDIFSEIYRICNFNYQLFIIGKTVDELKKIIQSRQKGKDKATAKLALAIINAKKLKILKTKEDKPVDDLILDVNDAIVATTDKELINRLKEKKAKIIRLRQKKYLIME